MSARSALPFASAAVLGAGLMGRLLARGAGPSRLQGRAVRCRRRRGRRRGRARRRRDAGAAGGIGRGAALGRAHGPLRARRAGRSCWRRWRSRCSSSAKARWCCGTGRMRPRPRGCARVLARTGELVPEAGRDADGWTRPASPRWSPRWAGASRRACSCRSEGQLDNRAAARVPARHAAGPAERQAALACAAQPGRFPARRAASPSASSTAAASAPGRNGARCAACAAR